MKMKMLVACLVAIAISQDLAAQETPKQVAYAEEYDDFIVAFDGKNNVHLLCDVQTPRGPRIKFFLAGQTYLAGTLTIKSANSRLTIAAGNLKLKAE